MSATASSSTQFTPLRDIEAIGPTLTLRQLVWRRFRRHRMAMVGAIGIFSLLAFIFAGSILVPESRANSSDLRQRLSGPAPAHWFGTDSTGRDVFARVIYGGQVSLMIGVLAVALEITLGTLIGGIAAYYGGWLDALLMRFTEALLTIPQLFLLIVLSKLFGNNFPTINILGRTFSGSVGIVILVIGATSWMYLARIVRANVLSLREMDYVAASRALGVSNRRIILAHLLPNTLAPITVAATLGVANAILSEAYVSFFGLGVQAPTASWGNMLDSAYQYLERAPWLWFFTGTLILLTVLSVNYVGDGLRDALDPHGSRHM